MNRQTPRLARPSIRSDAPRRSGVLEFGQPQAAKIPDGPLPWLDWKYSLILPFAILLLMVALLFDIGQDEPLFTVAVRDGSTQQAIANAGVEVGDKFYVADDQGEIAIQRPDDGTLVRASASGYRASTQAVPDDGDELTLDLGSTAISGTLTDQGSGEPVSGVTLDLIDANGATIGSVTTDASGTYAFADAPDGSKLALFGGPFGRQEFPVDASFNGAIALTRVEASGIVRGPDGETIQGALIKADEASAVTGEDGRFVIEGVGNGVEVTISASGYESTTAKVENGTIPDVSLNRQMIKAVYANFNLLTTEGGLDSLIEIANTTEINAIVIDIKQDTVYFDSENAFFNDAGTVNPIYDIDAVIQKLKDNDIYAIARIVVFQDPLVAQARPDLAVKDVSGELWVNVDGVAWVNAFNEELWDANIDLAVEVVGKGFDEIQYDYVRFPSDGDLNTADFGPEYTAEGREDAITEFMKRSKKAVNDAGGKLAADLFGFITIVDDEQYIGQRFSKLEPYLDFVCMMIYPSHFSEGNIASADGHPNDFPYETIYESLERAEANAPGSKAKFRPWLQDFSYGFNGLRDYDKDDVRAQIDAAEEFGASGWLLWGDPFNVTVDALKPEPGT